MKSCPVCGLIQDESCLFCPEDGSALTDDNAPGVPEAMTEEKSSAVVLYCPACAAEYPLTFKVCPIHVIPLTKHNVVKFVTPVYKPEKESPVQQAASNAAVGGDPGDLQVKASSPQRATARNIAGATACEQDSVETEPANAVESTDLPPGADLDIEPPDYLSGYVALANAEHNSNSQLRSHRIAAVVLAIGLSLFGVLALYTFYKNASSRSLLSDSKAANQSKATAQQAATVYTPQAALDYKEEKPEPLQESEAAPEDRPVDNERPRNAVALPASAQPRRDDLAEQKPAPAPLIRQQQPIPAATPVSAPKTSGATELILPRGTYGQVDARLLNVRSRKTASGFRYDLTFNMQEQAGRTTQWERLAIVTRSASGISHSQAMPFYHRLGAAGTLTFTVSVEMQGRAQPDWAGRIICTSIGTDQTGKAYRASFGANVAPR